MDEISGRNCREGYDWLLLLILILDFDFGECVFVCLVYQIVNQGGTEDED